MIFIINVFSSCLTKQNAAPSFSDYIYYDLFWNSIEPILQTNMQIELSLGLATSDYEYQS